MQSGKTIALKRPDGGIGRRAGLKHQWIHFHAGSIPALGTEKESSACAGLFLYPILSIMRLLKSKYRLKKTGSRLYRKMRFRKGFGVHSPFAFDLITKVIEEKSYFYAYHDIRTTQEDFIKHPGKAVYTDRKGKQHAVSYASLFKQEAISSKKGKLLFRLTNFFKPKEIVQLGTSLGFSSLYLAAYSSDIQVNAIENNESLVPYIKDVIKGNDRIVLHTGSYPTLIPEIMSKIEKVDFVFFNLEREYEVNLQLFSLCIEKAHENTVFVMNNIKKCNCTSKLWNEIIHNPKVSVTMDLYSMGIIFFNPKLHKRNYKVYF